MFTMPKKYQIQSDEGYSVQTIGRGQLLYCEGDRTLKIESEILMGRILLVVYSKSVQHWEAPHQHEQIDDATRRRILINIINAFASQDLIIEIKPPLWWPVTPDTPIGDGKEIIIRVQKS